MFCRFLELYLVSAFHAACAIGIIATNIAMLQSDQQRVGDLVMRTGSSDILSRGHRGRNRLDARLKNGRKARFRWLDLEGLESRTLLATTIPAATATGAPIDLSGNLSSVSASTNDGNANSPAVVVDPYDSQKLFAVWGVDESQEPTVPLTTAIVEGAYSNNGGTTWTGLGQEVAFPQLDPASNATPPFDYTQVTDRASPLTLRAMFTC